MNVFKQGFSKIKGDCLSGWESTTMDVCCIICFMKWCFCGLRDTAWQSIRPRKGGVYVSLHRFRDGCLCERAPVGIESMGCVTLVWLYVIDLNLLAPLWGSWY